MTERITVSSGAGTVEFGQGGFVLHALDCGAPALKNGEVLARAVTFSAYILPEGEDAAARENFLRQARRRISRIVGDAAGFTLTRGSLSLHLLADTAPIFSAEAPLNGSDAAFFTVRAHSGSGGSAFAGEETRCTGHGRRGNLIFPLVITEETVFAYLEASGELSVLNPGDMPCGFIAEIEAEGGALTNVGLSLGESSLFLSGTLAEGELLCFDTRLGHKDATRGGSSVLAEIEPSSEFFLLPPGESRILWHGDGEGRAAVLLRFTPLYY